VVLETCTRVSLYMVWEQSLEQHEHIPVALDVSFKIKWAPLGFV
jgi:hypothetical protein